MSDAHERFLDLATKPLAGNPELHVRARGEISSTLKPEMDAELKDASERLETSDRSKWKPTWVGLGLILFGLGLLGLNASMWMPNRQIAKFMLGIDQFPMTNEERIEKRAEMTRLIALGRPVKDQLFIKDEFNKLQDLCPSDPLYFAPRFQYGCYDAAYSIKVPLALLDRVSKIDPDNGWWPYIAATTVCGSLDLVDTPANEELLEWEPEEQERVDLSLRLFRQASAAPRFESYETAINSQRIALIPSADTVQDCISNLIYMSGFTVHTENRPSFLNEIVATQAQKLADQKDIPGFKILLYEWIKLERAKVNDCYQMDDLYWRTSSLGYALSRCLKDSRQLELHEEVRALEESIAILDQQYRQYPTSKDNQQAFRRHGSQLTNGFTTLMSLLRALR